MAHVDTDRRRSVEGDDSAQGEHAAQAHHRVLLWEWLVAVAGLLLVVGAVGYLSYTAMTQGKAPPLVTVEVQSILPSGQGWLVTFKAVNSGTATAAGLTIGGELKDGQVTVESSEATLDYLPSHSQREGGLFFTHDPTRYQLTLGPMGYSKP